MILNHLCKDVFRLEMRFGDHRDLHLSIRRQRQMCIRDRFRSSNRCIRNNRTNHTRYFLMTTPKPIEKEKLVAEKLNGRLAMLGIVAGLGAYLTTGQIIPGFV